MGEYEDEDLDYDRRPISKVEDAFQRFQNARAKSIAAEQTYKASMRRRGVPESTSAKMRTSRKNALRRLLATGQGLHTEAVAATDNNPFYQFYQKQAEKSMKKSQRLLYKLDAGGSRRKRNKSMNKVYSAHKKSKRRRVKSTRRRHKKSTIHHRSKY